MKDYTKEMEQLEKDLAFLGMPFYDAKPVIEKLISQVREDTIKECVDEIEKWESVQKYAPNDERNLGYNKALDDIKRNLTIK